MDRDQQAGNDIEGLAIILVVLTPSFGSDTHCKDCEPAFLFRSEGEKFTRMYFVQSIS